MVRAEGVRPGEPRQIIDTRVVREVPFPEDPQARFDAVFAAIGNSELKCSVLLSLTQNPIRGDHLHAKVQRETSYAWRTDRGSEATFCRQTLSPIGLVAEVEVQYFDAKDYIVGFKTTHAGEHFGQPIAAFLLQQSDALPFSLYEVFGPTTKGSGNSRAVTNRAKIIEYLAQQVETGSSTKRTVDVANQADLAGRNVSEHLEHLAKVGIVEYSAISVENKGFAVYTIKDSVSFADFKTVDTNLKLTEDIARLVLKERSVSSPSVCDALKDKYPNYKPEIIARIVSHILHRFFQQGLLSATFIGREVQSQVKITPLGLNIYRGLILPIKEALGGREDLLTEWRKIDWRQYAHLGILKYRSASSGANRRPIDESLGKVVSIIADEPGIRPKDIGAKIGKVPSDILEELIRQGKIRKVKEGRATRYYLVD